MTGTVPSLLGLVPADDTPGVPADRRQCMQRAARVAVGRNLRALDLDDPPFAGTHIGELVDLRPRQPAADRVRRSVYSFGDEAARAGQRLHARRAVELAPWVR